MEGGLVLTGKAEVNRGARLVSIKPERIEETGSAREWNAAAVKATKVEVDDPVLLDTFQPGETYTITIKATNQ